MSEYIERLIRCGFPPDEAYNTAYAFIKDFGVVGLEDYLTGIEQERYGVD